jgi:hypothetical protein
MHSRVIGYWHHCTFTRTQAFWDFYLIGYLEVFNLFATLLAQ